jgi:hypothetical protein
MSPLRGSCNRSFLSQVVRAALSARRGNLQLLMLPSDGFLLRNEPIQLACKSVPKTDVAPPGLPLIRRFLSRPLLTWLHDVAVAATRLCALRFDPIGGLTPAATFLGPVGPDSPRPFGYGFHQGFSRQESVAERVKIRKSKSSESAFGGTVRRRNLGKLLRLRTLAFVGFRRRNRTGPVGPFIPVTAAIQFRP